MLIENVRAKFVKACDELAHSLAQRVGGGTLCAAFAVAISVSIALDAFLVAAAIICAAALVMLLLVDTTSLVSTVLTTTVVCTLCLPLMFALKTCVREVEVLIGFIENEEEIAALSESIVSSSAYFHASSISKSIGWELPNTFDATMLKEHLTRVGALVQGNLKDFSVSLLGIVAKTGSMLVSFTTFSTALFYLLQSEGSWGRFLASLSPLSAEDNAEVYRSVKASASTTLQSSACIGIIHALSTYCVLLATSPFPVIIIPSVASGVMAVMPLIGSHVVWLPIALLLWIEGRAFDAAAVASAELFTRFYIDDLLLRRIPGNVYYVGLSVAAGMYKFGPLGFILGPLIVGMTITALDIYKRHLRRPLSGDLSHGKGGAALFSPSVFSETAAITPRSHMSMSSAF